MTRDMTRLTNTLSVINTCSFVTDKLSDSLVISWLSVTNKVSVYLVIFMTKDMTGLCDTLSLTNGQG
jgi:hypothetical protein